MTGAVATRAVMTRAVMTPMTPGRALTSEAETVERVWVVFLIGAVAVLPKPLDANSLRSAVDRALLRGAAPDATLRLKSLDDGEFHARHVGAVTTKVEE